LKTVSGVPVHGGGHTLGEIAAGCADNNLERTALLADDQAKATQNQRWVRWQYFAIVNGTQERRIFRYLPGHIAI
jgi:hypothetical protein